MTTSSPTRIDRRALIKRLAAALVVAPALIESALATSMTLTGAASQGGSPYLPQSLAIFAAFTTPPSAARMALINTCVGSLITAGVWAKLDALYMFAAADSQAALINWKNPGTYNATLVNSPAFVADQGFTGASTKYIDSGFNPTTATSPNYTQNSVCAFARSRTNVAIIGGLLGDGVAAASSTLFIYPRYNTNVSYGRVNTPGVNNGPHASLDSIGFWSVNRSSSTLQTKYKDAVSIATEATASSASANATIKFLVGASAEYGTFQAASGGFGGSLDATEQTNLYNAELAYMQGVGAA